MPDPRMGPNSGSLLAAAILAPMGFVVLGIGGILLLLESSMYPMRYGGAGPPRELMHQMEVDHFRNLALCWGAVGLGLVLIGTAFVALISGSGRPKQ